MLPAIWLTGAVARRRPGCEPVRFSPIPKAEGLKTGSFKKKKGKGRWDGWSKNSKENTFSMTRHPKQMKSQRKDNFISLAITWWWHQQIGAFLFTRYLMINYRMATFLWTSKIYLKYMYFVHADIDIYMAGLWFSCAILSGKRTACVKA